MATTKNENGVALADAQQGFINLDLSEIFGKFTLNRRVVNKKDGEVLDCFELCARTYDPNTGAELNYSDVIWPVNHVAGTEMAGVPDRPADLFVRIGWFTDENGKLWRGMKFIEVYDDMQHTHAWRPLGAKRAFEGAKSEAPAADAETKTEGE